MLRLESVAVADPMFLSEPARTLGTWLRHCDWDTALPRMEQLYGSQVGLGSQPVGLGMPWDDCCLHLVLIWLHLLMLFGRMFLGIPA